MGQLVVSAPLGAVDNSPARRVLGTRNPAAISPVGTTDRPRAGRFQPSLQDSLPGGARVPARDVLGYCRMSLRDKEIYLSQSHAFRFRWTAHQDAEGVSSPTVREGVGGQKASPC